MCYISFMESLDQQLDNAIDENNALREQIGKLEMQNRVLLDELRQASDGLAKRDRIISQKSQAAIRKDVRNDVRAYVKGDKAPTAKDRFQAITDPTKQTQFLRSLAPHERAELFLNL